MLSSPPRCNDTRAGFTLMLTELLAPAVVAFKEERLITIELRAELPVPMTAPALVEDSEASSAPVTLLLSRSLLFTAVDTNELVAE